MSFSSLQLEPCLPPVWARGGHAQTIIAHLLPSPRMSTSGLAVQVDLPDGDFLTGRGYEGTSDTQVLLFHGLAGSVDADYMQRSARVAQKLGHTAYLFNHRGCGEGSGLARGIYHSGRCDDVSHAIAWAKRRNPQLKTIAIGFSLSANALLLLLAGGRKGRETDLNPQGLPDAAVAVNPPIDLARAGKKLAEGLNRIYDFRFLQRCMADLRVRMKAGFVAPELQNQIRLPWSAKLTDFDEAYTAPAGGFKNAADYYAQCSTRDRLSEISTPTFLLTAADDPFVSVEDYRVAKLSDSVQLHIENEGGHVGYLAGNKTPYGSDRWLDYAIHEALQSV